MNSIDLPRTYNCVCWELVVFESLEWNRSRICRGFVAPRSVISQTFKVKSNFRWGYIAVFLDRWAPIFRWRYILCICVLVLVIWRRLVGETRRGIYRALTNRTRKSYRNGKEIIEKGSRHISSKLIFALNVCDYTVRFQICPPSIYTRLWNTNLDWFWVGNMQIFYFRTLSVL